MFSIAQHSFVILTWKSFKITKWNTKPRGGECC